MDTDSMDSEKPKKKMVDSINELKEFMIQIGDIDDNKIDIESLTEEEKKEMLDVIVESVNELKGIMDSLNDVLNKK